MNQTDYLEYGIDKPMQVVVNNGSGFGWWRLFLVAGMVVMVVMLVLGFKKYFQKIYSVLNLCRTVTPIIDEEAEEGQSIKSRMESIIKNKYNCKFKRMETDK